MRMKSLFKCGIRSFSRYALNTSAVVPPEKSSMVQRSVYLNGWLDGCVFYLGKRYRINCSASTERIGISSGHIRIAAAFVQKTQDYLLWIQIYGLINFSVFLLHRGRSCSLAWRDFFLRRYPCFWRKRQTVSILTGGFNVSIISRQVISGCFFISARIFCGSVSESFGFLPRR